MAAHTLSSMDWPAHAAHEMPWSPPAPGGTRQDRYVRSITVALPPHIADVDLLLDGVTATVIEDAVRGIVALDHDHGGRSHALDEILLRVESSASARLSRIQAGVDDHARALHGDRSDPAATAMAATTAATAAIVNAMRTDPIEIDDLLLVHHELMSYDGIEHPHAGRFRDTQRWVGGSELSPSGAIYVPPPAETVDRCMADLVAFASRDDLPALAQAAMAYAQLMSILPFTDGNGRIARALVNAILRRRGTTRRVVVPLTAALSVRRDHDLDLLESYRAGHAAPVVHAFGHAARIAAAQARFSAERVDAFPELWRDSTGRVRAGSATDRLLARLADLPSFTADDAHGEVGGPLSSVYTAIERLAQAGVVRPLTDRRRSQVWAVTAILDEVADLAARIAAAATPWPAASGR